MYTEHCLKSVHISVLRMKMNVMNETSSYFDYIPLVNEDLSVCSAVLVFLVCETVGFFDNFLVTVLFFITGFCEIFKLSRVVLKLSPESPISIIGGVVSNSLCNLLEDDLVIEWFKLQSELINSSLVFLEVDNLSFFEAPPQIDCLLISFKSRSRCSVIILASTTSICSNLK